MNQTLLKKIVQYIASNMERESALANPYPNTFMNDPYGLLDLIKQEANLTGELLDAWMVEAQEK